MRPILYQLAHRLIQSSPTPSYVSADRFHLHLSLLRQLGLYDEAGNLLDSDVGKSICATNLSCDELRREIWKQQGKTKEEGKRAEVLITEKRYVIAHLIGHCSLDTEIGIGLNFWQSSKLLLMKRILKY